MYNTSEYYRRAINQPNRVWALDGHIYTDAGQDIHITEKNIVQNSLVFKEGSTCSDTIQTGSTYSNSLDFSLVNNEKQFNEYNFENARISMKVGLQITIPPIYAILPAQANEIPIDYNLTSESVIEVHIPYINFGTTSSSFIFTVPNATVNVRPGGNILAVWGNELFQVPASKIPNGVILVLSNSQILVMDYATHEIIYNFSGNYEAFADQDTVTLFGGNRSGDSGISYVAIDNQIQYYAAEFGSTLYSNDPAPDNCFWDVINSQYIIVEPEMLSITVREESKEFEYVPLGIFNVISAGKKLSSIPISCMDNMYKLNVALERLNIVLPLTLLELFDLICVGCGLQSTASLRNELAELNLTIQQFSQKDYTCRDIIGYMGILIGKNIQVGRDGLLQSFWYENVMQSTDESTRVGNSSYEDLTVNIDGVIITDWEGNSYWIGDNTQIAEYDTNPLIQSEEFAQQIASLTLNQLNSVSYRPCTVAYVGDPSWQAGDIIEHIREEDGNIIAPLMLHSYKFRGTGTIESVGVTPEQNRQLTAAAKKLLKIQTQTKQDLNKGLNNMQQTILNQTQLITTALGFWPHIEYNSDGSIKGYYLMSTPIDSDTTTVWAFTSGGIGVSHTGIAGPYTSSWTADDTIVAHIITADMIRTGMLAALDDLLTIDLSNGLFKTLSAKGSTTIDGNEIIAQYWNSHVDTKPPVAYIKISADENDNTNYVASMRIVFASNDGQTYSYIGQDLTHDAESSTVTDIGQLTFASPLPIKIANSLEVVDSLMYDNIKIQRKNQEEGNTGIDFVSIS